MKKAFQEQMEYTKEEVEAIIRVAEKKKEYLQNAKAEIAELDAKIVKWQNRLKEYGA